MPMKQPTPRTNFRLTLGGLRVGQHVSGVLGLLELVLPGDGHLGERNGEAAARQVPAGRPRLGPDLSRALARQEHGSLEVVRGLPHQGQLDERAERGPARAAQLQGRRDHGVPIKDAWPSEYSISEFDASQATTPATERIEIIHGGIKRQ